MFTLGPNHTVQQYDTSPPALVKTVQYLPTLPSTALVSVKQNPQQANPHGIPGAAPPIQIANGFESEPGPVTLSTIQRTTNEMQAIEHARHNRSEMSSPLSSRSRTESLSSRSSAGHAQPRTDRSFSSVAASSTTFSTLSPSMAGRESMFSGGSSVFPKSTSLASSGRRSKGSRLRQEVIMSPEKSSFVDLFPRTRARLSSVPYTRPQPMDQSNLSADDLRKQMLKVVFGWEGDIEPLIRDELSLHKTGSTSAVLLSKWLGEVDVEAMATAIGSGSINSSDWMLLALSQMGGQASSSKLGQAFVQRLLQQGDVHTSATILLGLGNREDAVEVYVSRSFYMEAILLTCLVFPTEWQRQAHLVRRWGEFVVENSQQQLAIRCFSCTGTEPSVLWASPTISSVASPVPSIPQVLSPPTSPPPITKSAGPTRMTTKNSSLKLITSFGAPEQPQFKFPGLKSDDRTPTNAPGVTPIAESAVSPGGTPGGFLRPTSRSRNNLAIRTATPGGFARSRLPSIGETPVDVTMPLFPRPSALPTPNDSGSDKEKDGQAAGQSSDEKLPQTNGVDPPLLLSSARYNPGLATPGKTPTTALPSSTMKPMVLPDPSQKTLNTLQDRARARNGSRDKKPDGLQIQMPSAGDNAVFTDHRRSNTWSNGSIHLRQDARSDTRSPPGSGQSWGPAKSPSASGRSIDQYISSLDEANYHSRKHKGESRRRQKSREGHSREGRSATGEHKSRSKPRVHESSEDRGRGDRRYIRPAKRSPSSPIPMSPEDLQMYRDNASTDSVDAQMARVSSPDLESRHGREHSSRRKGVSSNRSGSKASDYSHGTVRRISPNGYLDSQLGSEASYSTRSKVSSRRQSPDRLMDSSSRGRSQSKNEGSGNRSPSSPLPMSPQAKYYQRSEDEDDRLRLVEANRQRLRSKPRSSSRRPRERGTSARRDASPDRRRLHDDRAHRENEKRSSGPQVRAAMEQRRVSGDNTASGAEQPALQRVKSDKTLKKEMAARELELRRESLARRPLAPVIPHPANLSLARPPFVGRSQTDLTNSPTSWDHAATPPKQSPRSPDPAVGTDFDVFENRAVSAGPYGLPATPRAMRHPKYGSKDNNDVPTMPVIPDNMPTTIESFYTGQQMREVPRSMSAPIPEQPQSFPVDLPLHPAFHRALRPSTKRSNLSPLGDIGQHRRRPSMDAQAMAQAPVTASIDGTLHAAESTVMVTNAEQPPLLPELQHLSAVIPPPPPPPPFHNESALHSSLSSGSGLGVINIAIDNQHGNDMAVIDVPAVPVPPQSGRSPPPNTGRSPPPTVGRPSSVHRRGRSDNFSNKIKGITDRIRSTSRGRKEQTKSPLLDQQSNTPSPYESMPPLYF